MQVICNPVNINYRYQFNADPRSHGKVKICREAADPSMICFQGRYYIFASMTLGVWVSDDLAHWENHRLPDELPLYDYAPDVRVMGDYVYFCASSRDHHCDRYRTRDILNGPYERIEGSFSYWDPNLFVDDDGRVYFYWGCSNVTPIYGVELDPDTMEPKGEPKELLCGHPREIGFERFGPDNSLLPASEEEIDMAYQGFLKHQGQKEENIPAPLRAMIRGMFSRAPYIEGAWMDKKNGRYYLQYATPGTQFNTYSDGVYVGDNPLGPFTLAENNPYSYKPGGFLPGAGHGSTMQDRAGNWWHAATMRISMNHDFERRVGLFPAGFDADGELFCNQRYGDWPLSVSGAEEDPWRGPAWMLLSAGKPAAASSWTEGKEPRKATEENVQTWWQAATNSREEWLQVDLGEHMQVHAVQVNFADDVIDIPCPGSIRGTTQPRYIDENTHSTQFLLEGSSDGQHWQVLADRTQGATDLSHDFITSCDGWQIRYVKVSRMAVPYDQAPCISGLRVFGKGNGSAPEVPSASAVRKGDLDMEVAIRPQKDAVGFNILFGASVDKLYHSMMVFDAGTHRVGALIRGRKYVVRVDAFNENGITEGVPFQVEE